MNAKQVREFFGNLKDVECPLTEELIKAGYQQKGRGYIQTAKELGIEVDFSKAEPNQWWHLIECYCKESKDDEIFTKRITCGELLFWMAEVSKSVDDDELREILDAIKGSAIPTYERRRWNKEIRDLCFDKIVKKVESSSK